MTEMAHAYEMAKAAHQHIYLDAEDFADLAEWYARHNDFVKADEVMQYALSLHPGNTDLLVEQAYERLDREDREGARQILQQIEEEGDDVTILRARLLLEYGREDDAELELDTLEYKYSQNNIIDVVYMYIETNHADKAGEWLEHWRWSTDNVDYCAAMADYLSAIGKFQQAIIYFNKLIDSNPYSPSYWYGLGRCYFELRQYDKAIDACEYALVSDAEYGDAYMLKGYAYSMLHNSGKAQENYEKAIHNIRIIGKSDIAFCLALNIFSLYVSFIVDPAFGLFEQSDRYGMIGLLIIVTVLLNFLFCLLIFRNKVSSYYKTMYQLNNQYMEMELRYFSIYKDSQTELRKYRHDMKNHLL